MRSRSSAQNPPCFLDPPVPKLILTVPCRLPDAFLAPFLEKIRPFYRSPDGLTRKRYPGACIPASSSGLISPIGPNLTKSDQCGPDRTDALKILQCVRSRCDRSDNPAKYHQISPNITFYHCKNDAHHLTCSGRRTPAELLMALAVLYPAPSTVRRLSHLPSAFDPILPWVP